MAFKTGILVMLVGVVIIGIMASSVSATTCGVDTSTWFWDGVVWLPNCTSCTEMGIIGYNRRDPDINSSWYRNNFFSGPKDAEERLRPIGYVQSCIEGQGVFTKGIGQFKWSRWQLNLKDGDRTIDFSQGPEINPIPTWCSEGVQCRLRRPQDCANVLALARIWHGACFENCLCRNVCNPGFYDKREEREAACRGRID